MALSQTQRATPPIDVPARIHAPFLVWVVLIATLTSNFTGETILGFQISGFGWLIPLIVALFVLLRTHEMPRFPFGIWLPWVVLAIGYLVASSAENALQRTIMILTPLVVGMAASKARIGEPTLLRITVLMDKFFIIFLIVILSTSGLSLSGVLPEATGLAPQAITGALLGVFFSAKYSLGSRTGFVQWLFIALVPVIAVTRTAIVATGLTLPLTFGPLSLWKRLVILVCTAIVGFLLFNTDRIQNKMFYSGQGTIFDISFDNPDFETAGRSFMKDMMEEELKNAPWFGFGANASEQFISDITDGLKHPHNDYLRLSFDYGYVGLFVFLSCMTFQMLHALRSSYQTSGSARLFLIVGGGAFIPFALLMATDNIILYAAFFGNLHFMLLGCGYGALANGKGHTNPNSSKLK